MAAQKAPANLGKHGLELWKSITAELAADGLELTARELRWLADACAEADLIAALTDALDGTSIIVQGSRNQDTINPIYPELRQHREALGRLLARLKLADPDAAAATPHRYDSTAARAAAFARWRDHG